MKPLLEWILKIRFFTTRDLKRNSNAYIIGLIISQVNSIDQEIRSEIKFKIYECKELDQNLFEKAQKRAQNLMENDSYPRFLTKEDSFSAALIGDVSNEDPVVNPSPK